MGFDGSTSADQQASINERLKALEVPKAGRPPAVDELCMTPKQLLGPPSGMKAPSRQGQTLEPLRDYFLFISLVCRVVR